jgi:hypothetical protein
MRGLQFAILICVTAFSLSAELPAEISAGQTEVALSQEPSGGRQRPEGEGPRRRPGGDEKKEEPGIKPYEKVITEEAVTDEGIFKVHRIKAKVFFEIPTGELNKEFALVSRIARNNNSAGYGGQKVGTRVVRWERKDDRVLFRNVSYAVVADPDLAVRRAVDAANVDPIIMAFDIKAEGPNKEPVIDVTDLYTSDIFEMSAKQRLQARALDRKRTFVERASSYPQNIEVQATHTYTKPAPAQSTRGQAPTPQSRFRRGMDPGTATVVMHYSMVKLPEDPMMPRLFDDRVGYFSVRHIDFGREEHRAQERRFITRWRLEKQDPDAELSEPIKPIVYWIDPATPEKWVPYMKAGVEAWQPAFEAAGFKNGIIAKEGPTPEEDPDWHPEDARYSVIRWLPSTVQNASGPHVHDPRTGEILESDIQFYHNIQNLLRSWYFLQVAPLDPRAQQLPFPDELMGELLGYVVTHEVGHTLGFQHNMKSSSLYTLDQVRDPEWVKEMGHVATLMDYSRFNYVAQPEDGIPPADLFPRIGPYDKWATMWGYKPIPTAKSSDEERPTLNEWALIQDEKPWLRFSTADAGSSDPGALTEAVGDVDAVKATELGVKNLERVSELLLPATSKNGEPWDDLEELYGAMIGQWAREMGHVTAIVGGMDSQQRHAGQEGVRFEPVPRERQAEAVRFLNENAFHTPEFMIRPDILRRIEPAGVLSRIQNAQQRLMRALLNADRITRLVEHEALDSDTYTPTEFLADIRHGIWSELDAREVTIDAYRRNTQRSYLSVMDSRLNGNQAAADDSRALLRGELRTLDRAIQSAVTKASDTFTRYHLEDTRDQIGNILDPKFKRTQSQTPTTQRRGVEETVDSCWPELIIRPE